MTQNNSDKTLLKRKEAVVELLGYHMENDEVMRAWGSADVDGQIPADAHAVTTRFRRELAKRIPEEVDIG